MSTRITCPGCGRYLLLPEDGTAETMSCPRCLTRIDSRSAPHPPSGVQVEPPAATSPSITGSQPASPGPARFGPGVDVNVRRDSRGTVIILVVLSVLGGIGFLGTASARTDTVLLAGVILMLGAGAVALLLAIRALYRASAAPGANTAWTLFRALLIIGIVGVFVMIAGWIFALSVCIVEGPRSFH